MTGELTPAADVAYAVLTAKLLDAADDGMRPPCLAYPFIFLSEEPEDRAYAARTCLECPAMVECARFALVNEEGWGVWGGVDVTRGQGVARADVLAQLGRITGEGGCELEVDPSETAGVPMLLSPGSDGPSVTLSRRDRHASATSTPVDALRVALASQHGAEAAS